MLLDAVLKEIITVELRSSLFKQRVPDADTGTTLCFHDLLSYAEMSIQGGISCAYMSTLNVRRVKML